MSNATCGIVGKVGTGKPCTNAATQVLPHGTPACDECAGHYRALAVVINALRQSLVDDGMPPDRVRVLSPTSRDL